MKRRLLIMFFVLLPFAASAAEFRVSPIRLDFGKDTKSAIVNVINDGAKTNLQIYPMEWTQDAEGKDKYIKTEDILYFPKVLILDKGETRIIRAGMKAEPGAKEKTYRLFIEEIPVKKKKDGVNVVIAIKFGVPVFVKPAKEVFTGEITSLAVSKGTLKVVVKNTGNSHVNIEAMDISGTGPDGKETFKKTLAGWYLLSGISRAYTTGIPNEICQNLSTVSVKVKSDKLNLDSKLSVDKSMCGS